MTMNANKSTRESSDYVDINISATYTAEKNKQNPNDNVGEGLVTSNPDGFCAKHERHFKAARNIALLLLYLAYYCYAMYCNFGDEGSIRLTIFTGFGLAYLFLIQLLKWESLKKSATDCFKFIRAVYSADRRPKVIRWCLYVVWTVLCVVYIVLNVGFKDANNLRSLGGLAAFILLLFLFSNNHRKVNWHCVFYGIILQSLFGIFVIKTSAGKSALIWLSDRVTELFAYSDVGAKFVFGDKFLDHPIAMQLLPQILTFIAFVYVLIYLGVIQFIVQLIGSPLAYILDVPPPETMNAVSNIFLGGVESFVSVLEYLHKMPTSGLFCVFVNALASCSGSTIMLFMAFGVPLNYLLSASAMSAPAALVCAKLIFPDTQEEKLESVGMDQALCVPAQNNTKGKGSSIGDSTSERKKPREESLGKHGESDGKMTADRVATVDINQTMPKPNNIGEAFVLGTTNGAKVISSILCLLIVSFAGLELLNATVHWFGEQINIDITLNKLLSYLFYPFVYIMGVDSDDCLRAGEFLGIRTLVNPVVPYIYLGKLINNRKLIHDYTTMVANLNETFTYDRTRDIDLPLWNMTLYGGFITERSEIIVSYALCGFASFSSLGILFGLVTTFVPQKLKEITATSTILRLLVAGTTASYLTACIAGVLT